jgi:hypothetical protein
MRAWHDRMTSSAMPSEEEAGFKIGQKPVPFKADMKAATVEGRKTMTTRTYKISRGLHTAESDHQPFAVIKVLDSIETTWGEVTTVYFRARGLSVSRPHESVGDEKRAGPLRDIAKATLSASI